MNEFSQSPSLTLLPAVDVSQGKAVRLTQGEAGTETAYGDPVEAAEEWMRQGAQWIHLVDLDAAFGRGSNKAIIRRVVKAVGKRVNVELSGGIRDDDSLKDALSTGAVRVNLGTAALENPEWTAHVISEYGEAVAVTDVTKDGTMKGPNTDLLRDVLAHTDHPVVASGGISSLDDIAALRELVPLGLEGAILGKALYAGAFTLVEAWDVAGH